MTEKSTMLNLFVSLSLSLSLSHLQVYLLIDKEVSAAFKMIDFKVYTQKYSIKYNQHKIEGINQQQQQKA